MPAASKPVSALSTAHTFSYTQLQPGYQLSRGRYTLQRPLSSGGMGAILLATDHEAFDRTVVVKALLDYFDPTDPQQVQEARDRFVQEARTLATLRHPAIPQIYTYFQDGSQNYIVMEYIEGQDLEQGLTRVDSTSGACIYGRAYTREEILRWGVALCRILDYLANRKPHAVVHHDIKPANLILDANSGDIRLVDFGTARARLLVQRGGVGLQQSNVYGTAGYAAPEQYKGESESRSDVYALAATLYHLATDDDPRDHPFTFPRLPQLGALGDVLGRALDVDVRRRPSATILQRELEALVSLADTHGIEAPDGTTISDVQALASWCETHWSMACSWLYGQLPDLIELRWGQTQLAHQLRTVTSQHAVNHDQGLDVVLEMLDPQGFGLAYPQLTTPTSQIDFGLLTPASFTYQNKVTVHNTGRRYVQANLDMPTWVRTPSKLVGMVPGEHATLVFSPWYESVIKGNMRDRIVLSQAHMLDVEIEVRAFTSRWRLFLRHHKTKLLVALLVSTLLFSCCGGGQAVVTMSNNAMWDYEDRATYATGVAAMDRSDWKGATQAFLHLHRPYHDSVERVAESYYQLGVTAMQRGAWTEAQAAFKDANGHKDAQQLLAQIAVHEDKQAGLRFRVEHKHTVLTAVWSPDATILATASDDGSIHLWQTHDGKLLHTLQDGNGTVRMLHFSADGQILMASYSYGVTEWWRVGDGTLLSTNAASGTISSPDGQISAAIVNNSIWLWDMRDGTLLRKLHPQDTNIEHIVFSPDGQTLVSSTLRQVETWRVSDGIALSTRPLPVSIPYFLAFTNEGELQAIGTDQQGIKMMRVRDGATLQYMSQSNAFISQLAQSPDGQLLAVSNQYNIVQIWRVSDGVLLKTLPQQEQTIETLAFSPDGRSLVIGCRDGIASIWDVLPLP